MEYNDLRSESLVQMVNRVGGLAAVASEAQVRPIAAIAARCTMEVAGSLENVWNGLHDVKVQVSGRLAALTAAIESASAQSSAQTRALVRWTKILTLMTGAYTIITGGLLIVAMLSRK